MAQGRSLDPQGNPPDDDDSGSFRAQTFW